jgi:hypothetical protein
MRISEVTEMADHSNLYHDALIRVHDIAKNGTRNQQAWLDVLDVVDRALKEARRIDEQSTSG